MRTLLLWATGLLGLLVGADVATAQRSARTVQDDLGMFGAAAKTKANADIARLHQRYAKELAIEAVEAPKRPANVDSKDGVARARFFDDWAKQRFANERIDGVLVLIVENPKIIRVLVGTQTEQRGLFTAQNRTELTKKIQEKLKAADPDGAFVTITSYVLDAFEHNAKPSPAGAASGKPFVAPTPRSEPARQETSVWTYVLWGVGILVVLWLVVAVLRGFSTVGRTGAGGSVAGGGGGGFMPGLLGGLFGAAAGMWLYDRFLGNSTPSAWGGSPGPNAGAPTDIGGEPSISGADYSAGDAKETNADAGDAGGDWGGDGGGGDWGGGGDGGGDW